MSKPEIVKRHPILWIISIAALLLLATAVSKSLGAF